MQQVSVQSLSVIRHILTGGLHRHNVKNKKWKCLKKYIAFASFCRLISLLASLCLFLLAGVGLLQPPAPPRALSLGQLSPRGPGGTQLWSSSHNQLWTFLFVLLHSLVLQGNCWKHLFVSLKTRPPFRYAPQDNVSTDLSRLEIEMYETTYTK